MFYNIIPNSGLIPDCTVLSSYKMVPNLGVVSEKLSDTSADWHHWRWNISCSKG